MEQSRKLSFDGLAKDFLDHKLKYKELVSERDKLINSISSHSEIMNKKINEMGAFVGSNIPCRCAVVDGHIITIHYKENGTVTVTLYDAVTGEMIR